MRKCTVTAWFVRVEPNVRRWRGCDETKRIDEERSECERIKKDIKRHVDDCIVTISNETEDQCEFCGATWTEGEGATHNGGCCEKDDDVRIAEEDESAAV